MTDETIPTTVAAQITGPEEAAFIARIADVARLAAVAAPPELREMLDGARGVVIDAEVEPWRRAVVAEAESWLRTPWHHNARIKGVGVDCGNLLIGCFVNAGLMADFELEPYDHDFMLHRDEEKFLGIVQEHLDEIEGPPQPGDVALWRYGRCFSHGAIVVRWPEWIIHALVIQKQVALDDSRAGWLMTNPVRFFSIENRRL